MIWYIQVLKYLGMLIPFFLDILLNWKMFKIEF